MNQQTAGLNWTELIGEYRTSGLSMAKWCQTKGLKTHQLAYRLQKARRSEHTETGWLSLDITETEAAIQIKIGQAFILVQENFDSLLLKKVVKALSNI